MGLHIICCGSSTKYAVDPPHQTQNEQYLSCYLSDFDETLKVGSWDHLNPIPHRGTSKINPTPHGGSGRNGPHYQEINCLYVFYCQNPNTTSTQPNLTLPKLVLT